MRPSPREFRYRTRMDYVFAWNKLGLRARGEAGRVVELEECLLVSERAWAAVLRARDAARRLGLAPYDYVAHRGYLRYVSVREAPIAGELMLALLTSGRDPAVRPLLDELEPRAESVVWASTDRPADVNFGDVVEWRGRPWIEERIGGRRYRFGPNSFFQGNPWQTEALYRHVSERVSGRVADLFCGVGGFALFAASRAEEVVGIDFNGEAIEFARHNAAANGVANARFFVGDAGQFADGYACDALILDPPRSGLGEKNVRKVLRGSASRILYVSCSPRALAEELPRFEGYRVGELAGFDLFPKTPHVEVVATLVRS